MRLDSFVRPFHGYADDLNAFWSKFMVTAAIQKWDSDAKKVEKMPLFLDGKAYIVWDELSADDKKNLGAIKDAVVAAFSMMAAQAYQAFCDRRLHFEESVDAYAADLKRLLRLSGEESRRGRKKSSGDSTIHCRTPLGVRKAGEDER